MIFVPLYMILNFGWLFWTDSVMKIVFEEQNLKPCMTVCDDVFQLMTVEKTMTYDSDNELHDQVTHIMASRLSLSLYLLLSFAVMGLSFADGVAFEAVIGC